MPGTPLAVGSVPRHFDSSVFRTIQCRSRQAPLNVSLFEATGRRAMRSYRRKREGQ